MSVAGRVIAALAAFALAGCGGVNEDSTPEEAAGADAGAEATEEPAEGAGAETTEPAEQDSEEEPEPADGTEDNPLPLGEQAELGTYEVAVTAVDTDATDAVLEANEFNKGPAEGNTFVLVTLAGTFVGGDDVPEGNPGFDLTAIIVGNDSRQYTDSDAMDVPPNDLLDSPTLESGGQFEGNFIVEVPTDALDGASLFLEEAISFDGDRAYWTLE